LGDNENAFYYYKLRSKLDNGFYEEKYESFYKCGDISEILKLDWYESFSWYMKAFEIIPRVEPLVRIAEYYRLKNNWIIAHTFIKLACELPYPEQCILFIDKLSYDYKRWHLYSIIAYYVGSFEEGEKACLKAIENGTKYNVSSITLDKDNLKFYLDKKSSRIVTKNDFIKNMSQEIKKGNAELNDKQILNKAKLMWKNREK
jgi:hypothetical protein